jgi:hypothetical protein
MTKKHYTSVAKAFAASVAQSSDHFDRVAHFTALREIADRLCAVFALDNPRFDRERFLTACRLAAE